MAPEPDRRELRSRAEAAARGRDLPSKVNADPIRLLHELQVHQIELELQNEELVATNAELDALRLKYTALYQSAPVGYLTLAADGCVTEMNKEALRLLGRDDGAVLGRPLGSCFDAASQVAFEALMAQLLAAEQASADELLLRRPKSVPLYVRADARKVVPSSTADGPLQGQVMLVLTDVSSLKYARDDISSIIRNVGDLP